MTTRYCYGIDLGTTNSSIATYSKEDGVEILQDENNDQLIPSIVFFDNDSVYIGKHALRAKELGEKHAYHSIKRLIGRKFDDPILQEEISHFNFSVESDLKGRPVFPLNNGKFKNKKLYPETISSLVLNTLMNIALQSADKKDMKKVVITVPANFNDYQRCATFEAGEVAGMDVIGVLSEPTAAAIYYAYLRKLRVTTQTIMVFDFGGGTLDVSIISVSESKVRVKSTAGDMHLGGIDIDNIIFKNVQSKVNGKIETNPYPKIVKAKESLLENDEQKIIFDVNGSPFEYSLTTEKLKKMCSDSIIPRVIRVMQRALDAAAIKKDAIDTVVMVGGSSLLGFIRNTVKGFMEREPFVPPRDSYFGAIAAGAAIYGAHLCKQQDDSVRVDYPESISVVDIIPMSVGLLTTRGVHYIIHKGELRPTPPDPPLVQYRGNAGCDFFRIKVCGGDEDEPEKYHIVSENLILAEDFDGNVPIIQMGFVVNEREILVIAHTASGKKRLKIETKKDAHTPEEIEAIKKDVEEFLMARKETEQKDVASEDDTSYSSSKDKVYEEGGESLRDLSDSNEA